MFHQRNGRSVPPGGGAGVGAEGEEPNGVNGHAHYQPQQPQFYGYNMREDKPRGGAWKKDATGAWIRDKGGGSTSNLSSNLSKLGGSSSNLNLSSLGGGSSVGNSLRNRRRTNSNSSIYIPSLSRDAMNGGDHTSGSPGGGTGGSNGYYQSQRGSSASPRAPNSKGFWVQEPEDFHQRWVDTQTPVSEGNGTPLTWPPTGGGGSRGTSTTCSSQPSSPRKTGPGTPPPLGGCHAATLPKMSGDGGEGGGGGGEVLDFQNRIKRFQQQDQHHQQQLLSSSSSSRTTSSSSQVKSSRMSSSQSHSSSNLLEASKQSSELKSTKTNLSELKSSMSEVKSNISEMSNNVANRDNYNRSIASPFPGSNKLKSPGFGNMGSMDALNDGMKQLGSSEQLALPDLENDFGLDTLPDHNQMSSSLPNNVANGNGKNRSYEQSKMTMTSSSKTKVVTDNNSYESATATGQSQENCKVQSGDVSYEESSKKAANKSKLTIDGVTAEKAAATSQNERQLRAGDVTHREGSQVKGASMKLSGEGFSAHKSAVSEANQRSTNTPIGSINHESSRQATKSGLTIKTKGVCTQQSSSTISSQNNISISGFEDLDILGSNSQPNDIQSAIMRYSGVMSNFVEELRQPNMIEGTNGPSLLNNIDSMIRKAWSVPTFGHELGFSLCNVLRNNGGLDILIDNCQSNDNDLKFNSAKVLEQCLTTENRGYVAEKGLENVVSVACDCTKSNNSVETSRVGTGILEHLFKHSEGTCSDIIKLGGLDAVLYECRKKDIETLRHCAGALANLSLYGGSENQQAMIERNVPMWLFPLAFHPDDNIKYYAFLAIAALGANKEIEAAVLQSGSLNLVEPFLSKQNPEKFANSTNAHKHGQSKSWLRQLVPVLYSKREEAKNLAAFHFSMEAGVKAKQENLQLFEEIGAIEPLKEVASSPNAIASKYAAQALRLMGEEVPHKLSQQVPVWTSRDVSEWVKQIGFTEHADNFASSRVDGDLLLQLTESNLYEDIGIRNGILRQRFQRELRKLKLIADYSSCDHTNLNSFLTQLDNEFAEYTYRMLQAGVTKDLVRYLSEEQLRDECGILNSIHRQRIRELILSDAGQMPENSMDKNLDVFISYRRSNGSQLASLLKVHLQLKGFSVFIDVERLEAGKFDNNLLSSIRQAKNFLLVLTPTALERCINDVDCKDWVHKEIVEALQSGCNIVPIIDNFQWPEPEELPEDMRAVCYFNGVRWIHDYQDACVDKLERFMRGEMSTRSEGGLGRYLASGPAGGMATPGTPSSAVRNPPLFQRTISTESGKGSSCSDKDFAKD